MHLLVNARFLTRQLTGVDRTAQELTRALARIGAQGHLRLDCAVPSDAPDEPTIRDRLALPASSNIYRLRSRGYAFEQVGLARLLPEANLLSFCNIGPVVRRRQLALLHDAQVYDAPSSYSPLFRQAYRLLQPILSRRVAHLATVSAYSRQRLRANGLGRDRRIDVVPNGVDHLDRIVPDPSILGRLGQLPGSYALALGHPVEHKNTKLLLDVYRSSHADLPRLVLAGAGTEGLPPTPGVVQAGRVGDGELKALYANARIFLFPSLTEGFGFPALEAMAVGCPVIAACTGAIPEVVDQAAVLLDPNDAGAWRDAILDLDRDEGKRHALGRAGRERAALFTWDRAARQLVDILARELG